MTFCVAGRHVRVRLAGPGASAFGSSAEAHLQVRRRPRRLAAGEGLEISRLGQRGWLAAAAAPLGFSGNSAHGGAIAGLKNDPVRGQLFRARSRFVVPLYDRQPRRRSLLAA